ncbi:MAG: hypothetical protein ACJ8C4_09695 [Gemmataceae bacterium]
MTTNGRLRLELRPPGPVAVTCPDCFLYEPCGGLRNGRSLFNCFDQFCCGTNTCDHVCPYKPEDYRRRMWEIGGLRFDDLPALRQTPFALPRYVPMVHHASSRVRALKAGVVALDPYSIFANHDGRYCASPNEATALRRRFKVGDHAQVILRGTAKDKFLERYWEFRKIDGVAAQVARLDAALFIGPNYSHFLDVPRSDLLYNRKRQLVCLAELSEAGVSVVPNLSAVMPADWDFWSAFLRDNSQLLHVAVNFQTGYRSRDEGLKAIARVQRMQDEIGRELSLILVGGAQYVRYAAERFSSFTLIDSQPFKKSVYRKVFHPDGGRRRRWDDSWTAEGQPIDDLMQQNVEAYASWVETAERPIIGSS